MATINRLKTVVSSWISWVYDPKDAILPMQSYNRSRSPEQDIRKVEDYRAGFPRFSALIACHDFFYILRPFRRIRARLLLLKQDKLAILEEQLDKIDADEPSPLFLGASRHDRNESRAAILREIDSCLVDYDSFVERTHHILSLNHASSRDILSLQHWLKGTGCVNRAETSYLKNEKGLISLGSTSDSAMKQLEDWTEDQFIRHYPNFRAMSSHDTSIDSNVYINSGSIIKRSATALMLLLITSLLLVPVVICVLLNNMAARIIIIIISTAVYLTILAHLTRSKMIELILAAATFATVLTVFISNADN